VIGYWISFGWQFISLVVSVPHNPKDIDRLTVISGFTQPEIIIAMIGLVIGLVTSLVIFFDFEWHDDVAIANSRIKKRWREMFPKREIQPEQKPKKSVHDENTLDTDATITLRNLKSHK